MKVLVGNMTFFDLNIDGKLEAHIHSATEINLSDDYDVELLLNEYECYLIPELYNGKIIYTNYIDTIH